MAILMITHDLGVVAEMAGRVIVMYAGNVMEQGDVLDIFRDSRHPYTLGLRESIPRLGRKGHRLAVIPGMVPDPADLPTGCRFSDRCKYAEYRCDNEPVDIREVGEGHFVRCWKDIRDD